MVPPLIVKDLSGISIFGRFFMIKKTSIYVQFEDTDRPWAGSRILGIWALGRPARGVVDRRYGRFCETDCRGVWIRGVVDFAKRIRPVAEVCPDCSKSESIGKL